MLWKVCPTGFRVSTLLDWQKPALILGSALKEGGRSRLTFHVGEPLKGASAKISRYSSGNVDLEVESPQAGLLVLMDNNYPGWVARVNAETRPIRAIYPACRAVAVPAGRHRVTFSYEPTGFRRVSSSALLRYSGFDVIGNVRDRTDKAGETRNKQWQLTRVDQNRLTVL
jgi:hypothetical protein